MSLSSLLLASGPKKIDKELDDLFKSNPAPPRKPATAIQAPTPGSAPPAKKRKIEATIPDPPEGLKKRVKPEKPAKLAKTPPKTPRPTAKPVPAKKSKRKEAVVEMDEDSEENEDSDNDEDNSDLENAYIGKKLPNKPSVPVAASDDEDEASEAVDSDPDESDDDAPPPVHESLTKRVRTKPAKKTKIVPSGETPVQRDARTLFVGGLPVEVAQKKPIQKQLSRHILSFLPSSFKVKIESMRFRSVAFRDPTSSTALSSSAAPAPAPGASIVNSNSVPIPGASNHSKARASTWRQTGGAADEKSQAAADGDSKKEYLTPAQKKKILFIQGAFHPEANGVNAYVVLAHHKSDAPVSDDPDSPYNAALHLARAANSSEFMERTLRVDVCARLPDAGEADGTGPSGDPKLSIFIGNLDFGSRESDVREFFEGVLAGERGPAPAASEDGSGGRWVQGVRLIRDRETQLGKGFGYVRFVDRECVDEILALAKTDEGKKKLKFAKRTLRVQHCRVVGASSSAVKPSDPKSKSTYPATPPKRGDPTLGARLAHLDKDERKAVKKADADRVDRRAEKKKLMVMRMHAGSARDKIKAVSGGIGKRVDGGWKGRSTEKGKGKDRERERKARVHKNTSGSRGRK